MKIPNGNTIKKILEDVASLKTDVEWLKKLIYIAVGSSATAALGVLGQILVGMFKR